MHQLAVFNMTNQAAFGEPKPSTSHSLEPEGLATPLSYSPHAAADALRKLSILDDQTSDADTRQARPQTPRATTDPSSMLTAFPPTLQPPRTRSPYSRVHVRSQSSSSSLAAPPMMRAHSSPTTFASPTLVYPIATRSTSPLRSPARTRSPYRSASDEQQMPLLNEDIPEDSELDLTPKPRPVPSPSFNLAHGNTFPRRRRPASPLHHVILTTSAAPTSSPSSVQSSPLLSATRFNESFPADLHHQRSFSSSSVPSTPTSTRSRSPSISSLETIPDSPDAEEQAIEEDNIARLKAAADQADGKGDAFRRSSFDVPGSRPGFGGRDKRKRWSVCGAERRQDLNLDTIWED